MPNEKVVLSKGDWIEVAFPIPVLAKATGESRDGKQEVELYVFAEPTESIGFAYVTDEEIIREVPEVEARQRMALTRGHLAEELRRSFVDKLCE